MTSLSFGKLLSCIALVCLGGQSLLAQYPGLTLPFSGNNQRSAVSQSIGPVKVAIEYSSPAVHGPGGEDRRGKIWGKLVPYGMANLGFGNGKPSPWRGGANENTVFETSHPVLIQGRNLPAGRYGVHMIPAADKDWTLIFSRNSTSWGSFFYEESEDAPRVPITPVKHEYREWLAFEFTVRRPTEATVELQWEDLALPWTIKVERPEDIYISKLNAELRNSTGFTLSGVPGRRPILPREQHSP